MSMITQALAEFNDDRAMIATVKEYGKFTLAVDGFGKCDEAHKQVKRLRINIPKRGKDLRDGANTYCKAIIAEEKRLLEEVQPIEDALAAQCKIHNDAEKKRLEEKHAAKRAVLTARIEKLAQAGCIVNDVAALEAMTDDEFHLHFLCERRKAEMIHEEQEAARLEAEKFETDRLAEVKRQSDEIRIRQAELDSERKAMAAEREAMQHQQQIERRALEEQQAEVRRQQQEIQREADRKTEAERQRVLAERKAEDDRLAVIAAEQKEVARQARLEALKPEIEKAAMFANRLAEMSAAVLVSMEKPVWGPSAMMIIRQAGIDVIKIARGELR